MMKPWSVLVLLLVCGSSEARYRCDRRPFRTIHPPTESNGRFELTVYDNQVKSDVYMPAQQYEVTLKSNDPEFHFFTAIMVWPEGQTTPDPDNPRKTVVNDGGTMRVHEKYSVKMSERCDNTIEMLSAAPSTYVQMYWVSPAKDNGCVTLHAMVAENEEVWYQDGEGLSIQVCEDTGSFDDVSEGINENCTICEEAKYELQFEGQWSRNTHPHKFPENDWSVYYSDFIGAAHSVSYTMWKDGSPPSDAMKEFAMRNDTAIIEEEILKNYGRGYIRTLIKGKGHGPRNGDMNDPTYALVRVDRKHHLISTATAIRPSPDWFLGVSNYELCSARNNSWLTHKTVNLKPWDAGVSGGISFESPYVPTNESIGRVKVGSFNKESPFYNMNFKQVRPFAVLTIRLIRTYPTECKEETEELEGEEGDGNKEQDAEQPEPAARRTSPLPQNVVESDISGESNGESDNNPSEDCPLSGWDNWTPCSNECGPGYRSRSRYHLVNGVQYRYYKKGEIIPKMILKPSDDCLERQRDATLETESCEGSCFAQPQPLVAAAYKSNGAISRQDRMTATSSAEEVQDCVMSAWSQWAACSGSCGEGRQLRARNIIREPSNGGSSCPKDILEARKCMLQPCPVL